MPITILFIKKPENSMPKNLQKHISLYYNNIQNRHLVPPCGKWGILWNNS